MKQGKTDIVELAKAIQHEADNKKDYVSPSQLMSVEANGALKVSMQDADGEKIDMPMSQHASRQLGAKFGIPAKYFDKMLKDAPDLLATNANHWLHKEPKDLMVRTLFGNVRGIMSNRYQRIDNVNIAEDILPFLLEQQVNGLEVASCEVTEKKLYIKCVMHSLTSEVKVGDIVEAGLWISNSEIGCGEFEAAPFIHRLSCLNGLKINEARFGKRHIGTRANVNDSTYSILSDETLRADDKAFMLKARDVVKAAFDEKRFEFNVNKLRDTTNRKLEGNPVKAVEVLGNSSGLLQGEQEGILRKLIEGADLSQYGLVQAVTSYSQDVDSYDRASDLEELGGKIVDLTPEEWKPIAVAA